jgi:hypothetical protein
MRKNLPVIKNAKDRRVSGGERALPQGRYTLTGVTESGIVAICPPLSISESAFY